MFFPKYPKSQNAKIGMIIYNTTHQNKSHKFFIIKHLKTRKRYLSENKWLLILKFYPKKFGGL